MTVQEYGIKPSQLKVMKSAAGFYIGRSYDDPETGNNLPYSRESEEYYATHESASVALRTKQYTTRDC